MNELRLEHRRPAFLGETIQEFPRLHVIGRWNLANAIAQGLEHHSDLLRDGGRKVARGAGMDAGGEQLLKFVPLLCKRFLH